MKSHAAATTLVDRRGEQSRASPHVAIGVGYGWNGAVHEDARWGALRRFLKSVCEDAVKRATRLAQTSLVEDGDDLEILDDIEAKQFLPPTARVRRLRATTGQFVWDSIKRHIEACDILVFDITETKVDSISGAEKLSPNVWIELGYALALNKPVFVVAQEPSAHRSLPSDLSGLMVGHIDEDGGGHDISLRMSLVQTVLSRLTVPRETSRDAPREATSDFGAD